MVVLFGGEYSLLPALKLSLAVDPLLFCPKWLLLAAAAAADDELIREAAASDADAARDDEDSAAATAADMDDDREERMDDPERPEEPVIGLYGRLGVRWALLCWGCCWCACVWWWAVSLWWLNPG